MKNFFKRKGRFLQPKHITAAWYFCYRNAVMLFSLRGNDIFATR